MKIISFLSAIILTVLPLAGQTLNPEYDSVLAKSLGADELGMKTYILVILKTGSANITDTALRARLFRGHFENMDKMSDAGKLVSAGPLDQNEQSFRGIFILNTDKLEEAQNLMKDDPTVLEKIFEPLYFLWYGSAALPEHVKIHKKIQKFE